MVTHQLQVERRRGKVYWPRPTFYRCATGEFCWRNVLLPECHYWQQL